MGMSSCFDSAGLGFGLVPLDKAVSAVLNEERKENTSHENGGRGSLVRELAKTLVGEHEVGMCVEL